jgi:hypothetical protein
MGLETYPRSTPEIIYDASHFHFRSRRIPQIVLVETPNERAKFTPVSVEFLMRSTSSADNFDAP